MRRFYRLGLVLLGTAALVQGCSSGSGTPAPHVRPGLQTQLANDTGASWTVIADDDYGNPSFLEPRDPTAPSLVNGATPESAAREFFQKYAHGLGIGDPDNELVLEEAGEDASGLRYAAFLQQTLAGTPVFGTRLTVVYARDGSIAFVSGRFAPNAAHVSASPALTPEQAIAVASARLLSDVSGLDPNSVQVGGTPRLLVYAPNATTHTLAYEVVVAAYGPSTSENQIFLVDASTGGVLFEYAGAHTLTGSGYGVLYYAPAPLKDPNDKKSFEVKVDTLAASYGDPQPYIMERDGSADETAIRVEKPISAASPNIFDVVRSGNVDGWDVAGQGSAVDAYYNFGLIDQFYRKQLGRKSYDDNNAQLKIIVHDQKWNKNAAWVGSEQAIHIGDKGTNKLPYSVEIDVLAHEFQHAVTEKTIGLIYSGESGALNESISDIFGAFAEHSIRPGPGNTKHAELAPANPPDRDLGAPGSSNSPKVQPDFYTKPKGTPVANELSDWGGVHYNSGISNNAWYLMTIGGTNSTSKVTLKNPLGWETSQTLWYSVLRAKTVAASAQFTHFALAMIAAAKQLPNGDDVANGPVRAVACAWSAVGVLSAKDVKDNWKVSCDDTPVSAASCAHKPCETGAALATACSPCTAMVCLYKPECCDPQKSWTAECVTQTQETWGACASACYDAQSPSSCAHNECTVGATLDASCSKCAAAVCEKDSYCCSNTWDFWCAQAAARDPFCKCDPGTGG